MKINKRKIKKIFLITISVILLFSIYLNTYLLLKYNILPFKYLLVYFVIVGLIPILLIFFTIFIRLPKIWRIILPIIEIIYIIILFVVFFYLNQTFNFLDEFTSGFDYETKNYYVLTLNESGYNKIDNLENKKIGYSNGLDLSITKAIETIERKVDLNHQEYNGFTELFNALENKEIDSVLIIDGFYDLLKESENTTVNKTTIIYEFSIKEKINEIKKDVDVTKETFNIYLSGMDSYGSVTDKTLSDVNILMNINPQTNKILMISIPRDYYVELAGFKQKDKLTHAGIYGVETSVKTIENLLDVEINYYVKVNYNALIKLVDALGGVDVYSKYAFTSTESYIKFKKGYNTLNGREALEFVRTRKAFLEGDRVRGENQQAMIQAIIKKASDVSILLKYDDILKSLEGCFTTNISTDKIMSIVNMQLDKMPSWSLESISLNGSDSHNYTYTYPTQELYVMIPNEETITTAKNMLKES